MQKLFRIFIVVAIALTLSGCNLFKPKTNNQPSTNNRQLPTPTPPETQLAPEERPIANMRTDTKTQRLFFTVDNLQQDVKKVEYTVTYKTKDLERGGFGIYETGQKKDEEFLFGSESSGKFKYDDNVNSIVLTLEYDSLGRHILLRYPYTIPTTN